MKEIAYDYHVPSWSWMAYSGGIQFMDIPLGEVDWADNLRFDEECECDHAIIANLWAFHNCTMESSEAQYAVLDAGGAKIGWIQYDVEEGEGLGKEWCIVVGKHRIEVDDEVDDDDDNALDNEECYILIVRPKSVDAEYRRVGVGMIRSGYVARRRINVRVV
jgi:hypothetical protein